MRRPSLMVNEDKANHLFDIEILGGNPGTEVENEISHVSAKHSLAPEGGCYHISAKTANNETVHFLGGLYVPPKKLKSVLADLERKGYEILRRAATVA